MPPNPPPKPKPAGPPLPSGTRMGRQNTKPVKKAAAPAAPAPAPKPAAAPAAKAPAKKAPARKAAAPKAPAAAPVVPATAALQPTGAQPQLSAELLATVQQLYGDYMMHFVTHPEIGPIIAQAAQNGWSADRLKGALSNTNWWKQTSDSARQWEQLTSQDPASAKQQVDQVAANIGDQAALLGLTLDKNRIRQIAEDSLRFGWDAGQITDTLVHEVEIGGSRGTGTIDALTGQIKALAHNYMLPLSDTTAFEWAVRVMKNELSMDTVKFMIGEQAKSRFPALAGVIDQGGTPADFFAPYKEIAAQTLEIPSAQIDFTQGKWSTVLQAPDDPNNVMRLTDFQRLIKKDPSFGYQYTNGANDMVDQLSLFLGDRFGAAVG